MEVLGCRAEVFGKLCGRAGTGFPARTISVCCLSDHHHVPVAAVLVVELRRRGFRSERFKIRFLSAPD